jgi:hypothetical protein
VGSKRVDNKVRFHEAEGVIRSETTKFGEGKELGAGEGMKEKREGIQGEVQIGKEEWGWTLWQVP